MAFLSLRNLTATMLTRSNLLLGSSSWHSLAFGNQRDGPSSAARLPNSGSTLPITSAAVRSLRRAVKGYDGTRVSI